MSRTPIDTFPLCVPKTIEFNSYHGYLTVDGNEYAFELDFGPDSAHFRCSPELQHILAEHQSIITQRLAQSADVDIFLNELKDILEKLVRSYKQQQHYENNFIVAGKASSADAKLPSTEYYSRLMNEIDAIGWERIVKLCPDLNALDITITDKGGREHIVSINIPSGEYPRVCPECSAALPMAVDLVWNLDNNPAGCTLLSIIKQYEQAIDKYQDLWDVLKDLDANTWILEPEHPSFAHTMRRIGIGNHSSLQIELDPLCPRGVPECRFLGADSVVVPLRDKLNQNILAQWDYTDTPRNNLQRVLGIEFPRPKEALKEDFSVECGICYSYRLNNQIPDKVCDNCCMPFHRVCLFEWLRSVPSTRQSFDTLFGNCPYCSASITVKESEKRKLT